MFTLSDVFAALGRDSPEGSQNVGINGIQIDSRLELTDRLFVAVRSGSGDGNNFVGDAFAGGAAAAIVQESSWEWPYGRQLVVEDSIEALGRLGAYIRGHSHTVKVIGVTGSNGKTTTKEAVSAALSAAGTTVKSQRSFNNELGVPITLAEIDESTDFAVVEMGAQVVGEIAGYCRMATPNAGIISNVGRAHLGLFGSAENVARAKGELAESIGSDGVVVLNRDDPWSQSIRERTPAQIAWFGTSDGEGVTARYSALDSLRGCSLDIVSGRKSATVRIPAIGRHLAGSFGAALACGEALGVDFETLVEGLGNFEPAPHRMEVLEANGITIVDDSHNANLNSVLYALAELEQAIVGGQKIAVLGDMLELGEFAEADHRAVGSAAGFLDQLITIGDASRLIGETASSAGIAPRRVSHYAADPTDPNSARESIRDLAGSLRSQLREGDVVLVKGSNALGLHRIVDEFQTTGD